jgi:hypothetical protein
MPDYGAGAQGALGGAASGAAMGSVAGPWGAAIGGIAGGVIGGIGGLMKKKKKPPKLEGGQEIRDYARGQLAGIHDRAAPQAGGVNVGPVATYGGAAADPAFRQMQLAEAQRQAAIAGGQQAGAGELAVNRQAARALAAQHAIARSQRGMSGAAAGRTAARAAAGIGVDAAGQSQIAALQDQAAAGQALANVAGAGRAGDLQQAGMYQQAGMANQAAANQRLFQQAGLDQSTQLANMQAALQARGMNDQAAQAYLNQIFNVGSAEMSAKVGQQAALAQTPSFWGNMMQNGATIGAAYLANRNGGGG